MREHIYFVYMLASKPYGTLYTGVTNNLIKRVSDHKEGVVPGFTKKYDVKMLVWYEYHADIRAAIEREKRIKRWRRDWKISISKRETRAGRTYISTWCTMGPGSRCARPG